MPILTEDQVNRLDRRVDELQWSTRALNVLKTVRIQTVRDLVGHTPQQLMRTRMCGKKTVKEIETIVEGLGFRLGMELPLEKISSISLVELAVAFATRGKAVCTYTDPRDGKQTQNYGLIVRSIRPMDCRGGGLGFKHDVEAELVFPSENVPISILYCEEEKEGMVERKQPDSAQQRRR